MQLEIKEKNKKYTLKEEGKILLFKDFIVP